MQQFTDTPTYGLDTECSARSVLAKFFYMQQRPSSAAHHLALLTCRAKCMSLVCQNWRTVEGETRQNVQPTLLTLDAKQCSTSYLTWHVGQKLIHLEVDALDIRASDLRSLQQAFSRASALQSLRFSPPAVRFGEDGAGHRLSILKCLTQLTELRLHFWDYRSEDVQHVAALSALSNLKVCSLFCSLTADDAA